MQIRELSLVTRNIREQRAFYAETLGLTIETDWGQGAVFKVGSTHMTFYEQTGTTACYHFAFNIPENQIDAATSWLQQRVPLISAEGQSRFSFERWNAHAIYFYDPMGNIVEFIARHTLQNATALPFGSTSLLCVSEIGLAVNDVPAAVRTLTKTLDVPIYDGENSDVFTAVGDPDGLLIVVKTGRLWYPQTGIEAQSNHVSLRVEQSALLFNQKQIKDSLLSTQEVDPVVEAEFIASWDRMIHFFDQFLIPGSWGWLASIIPFIQELRKEGYDRKLRAGQSMTTFVLSRSIRHGLHEGQASLAFELHPDGQMTVNYYSAMLALPDYSISRQLSVENASISTEIEGLIIRLLMQPLD